MKAAENQLVQENKKKKETNIIVKVRKTSRRKCLEREAEALGFK